MTEDGHGEKEIYILQGRIPDLADIVARPSVGSPPVMLAQKAHMSPLKGDWYSSTENSDPKA